MCNHVNNRTDGPSTRQRRAFCLVVKSSSGHGEGESKDVPAIVEEDSNACSVTASRRKMTQIL